MEIERIESIQNLPFFTGLTMNEVVEILSHVHAYFKNYHQGETIVCQGEVCKGLIYVVEGEAAVEYRDTIHEYSITEHTHGIHCIEPINLFGMYHNYSRTYTCKTDCKTLVFPKLELTNKLLDYRVIRLSLINDVCYNNQKLRELLSRPAPQTTEQRIVHFIASNVLITSGPKDVWIKMETMADIICDTRLNVSKVLNSMNETGLIVKRRQGFHIADFTSLQQRVFKLAVT